MESMDRFCWSCGLGISKGDQFCRKCGSDLGQGQPIEQGHEIQPEASTLPEIDPPKAKPTHVAEFSVLRPPPPKKAVVKKPSPESQGEESLSGSPWVSAGFSVLRPPPAPESHAAAVVPTTSNPLELMVSFPDAVKLGFQRYFEFKGRSTRAEYWWWSLFQIIAVSTMALIDGAIGLGGGLVGISFFGLLIPGWAVLVRRLHDTNKTGWWCLLWVVPFVFAVQESDIGTNKYGPNPRQAVSQQPYNPPSSIRRR